MNFKEATEKEEAEEEQFRRSRIPVVRGSRSEGFTSPAGGYYEVATVAESAGCPEQRARLDESGRLVHHQEATGSGYQGFRRARVHAVQGSGGQGFTSPAGVYHEVATVAKRAGCPEQRARFDECGRLVHRQLCPHFPQPAAGVRG